MLLINTFCSRLHLVTNSTVVTGERYPNECDMIDEEATFNAQHSFNNEPVLIKCSKNYCKPASDVIRKQEKPDTEGDSLSISVGDLKKTPW